MRCEHCDEQAISTTPRLCAKHFDEFFVQTAKNTIERYGLCTPDDRICVAVSGGKDSLALLDVMTRLGYRVEGLFINEGIAHYREASESDLDAFCTENDIKVRKVSFEDEAGFTLDKAMNTKQFHSCTLCGTLRRYLMNKYAKEYDVVATGHNLDDEAQTVLINLARGNTSLQFRQAIDSGEQERFVRKIKPFAFISEKQVLTYVVLRGIKVDFAECPYAFQSYRANVRDILNRYEESHPGAKRNILNTYLALRPRDVLDVEIGTCKRCGEAAQDELCKACRLTAQVQEALTE